MSWTNSFLVQSVLVYKLRLTKLHKSFSKGMLFNTGLISDKLLCQFFMISNNGTLVSLIFSLLKVQLVSCVTIIAYSIV